MPGPPAVLLTADAVLFSLPPEAGLSVLLVRRGSAPYKGRWALPGGFVEEREDLERAARRELREETGVASRGLRLDQLGAYGAPRRDPRGRVISVAYVGAVPPGIEPTGADDAADAAWVPVSEALGNARLAFDHADIVADGVTRMQALLENTNRAVDFLDDEFTIAQLRAVYEAVWGHVLDPGNFQRKVTNVPGLLHETGWQTSGGRGRPAALYTAGPTTEIWPAMSRDRDR